MRMPESRRERAMIYVHIALAWCQIKIVDAWNKAKYTAGFIAHVVSNRKRYMIEYDKIIQEEIRIKSVVDEIVRQNESSIRITGKSLAEKDAAFAARYTISGMDSRTFFPESMEEKKKKEELEEAKKSRDNLNVLLEPLPGSSDSLVAASRKILETNKQ